MQEVGTVYISSEEYRKLIERVRETIDYELLDNEIERLNKDNAKYKSFIESNGYYKGEFEKFLNEGEKDNG